MRVEKNHLGSKEFLLEMESLKTGNWTDRNGAKRSVGRMSNKYIFNVLKLLADGQPKPMRPALRRLWIHAFIDELARRMEK